MRQDIEALAGHSTRNPFTSSKILWPKTRILANPGESSGTDLLAVVKAKRKITLTGLLKFSVRSDLLFQGPAETEERGVNPPGLGGAPNAQAANKAFSGSGTSSPLATMSANTWRAIDFALRTAA